MKAVSAKMNQHEPKVFFKRSSEPFSKRDALPFQVWHLTIAGHGGGGRSPDEVSAEWKTVGHPRQLMQLKR